MTCFVKTCKNIRRLLPLGSKITFHRFPTNEDKFDKWLSAIDRIDEDLVWSATKLLCSDHFKPEDFISVNKKRCLKKTACPVLNIHSYEIAEPYESDQEIQALSSDASLVDMWPDPTQMTHDHVLAEETSGVENSENEEEIIIEATPSQTVTTWSQTETLALINIFSLFKDKFKDFKKRKEQWVLISNELARIGIHKRPVKCEIKWKNLLRVYRQYKSSNKGQGKFEFFNELDDIVANDPQFKYLHNASGSSSDKVGNTYEYNERNKIEISINGTKRKCSCSKSEKQKRHEDRMALMAKKMEIEERKVKAFEEYLQFLKSSSHRFYN